MQILTRGLPLFPLHTVLFPHMSLPLHIFEPRYREMVGRCLAEQLAFGVVLIKGGQEVGGSAIPYRVGTAARIVQVERIGQGRLNIDTIGVARFRVLALQETDSFATADIEIWEDEPGESRAVQAAVTPVRSLFKKYILELLAAAGDSGRPASLPVAAEPQLLSYAVATALQIGTEEKQSLLETPTVAARLAKQVFILVREIELIRWEVSRKERLTRESERHYLN